MADGPRPTEGERLKLLPLLSVIAAGFLAILILVAIAEATAAPRPDRPPTPLVKRIDRERAKTFACQQQLGLKRSPVSSRPIYGRRYARYVLTLWRARAHAYCSMARELGHPVAAIRAVWGPEHAGEALSVARCESGLSTRARNGQYLGLFQCGAWCRERYGHGDSALEQARAAHGYWLDSGWSGWQCSPHGGLAW